MGTANEHRERVDEAATRWLDAARAYITALRDPHPDGIPSVCQQQSAEAEWIAVSCGAGGLGCVR
jgi:hypothetical protein